MTIPWAPRLTCSQLIAVTPVITAGAYTSGQQLGGVIELTNMIRQDSFAGQSTCLLVSATIIDGSGTKPVIDLWFFNASPTVSGNGTTFDLTDAEASSKAIAAVSIGTSYSASASNAVSTDGNALNKILQVPYVQGAATISSVYMVAVIRSGVSFGSVSDITFKIGCAID